MTYTSWKEEIENEMFKRSETWEDVVAHTFEGDELERVFDGGFGGEEGVPFTLWTAKRVYFPVCYDGAEWCGSVPRDPSDEKAEHWGGG